VSDPFGAEYKKYLSLDDVADLLHPAPTAEERASGELPSNEFVLAWLAAQPGLLASGKDAAATKVRDLVSATLNAQAAEQLFGTELFHYTPASVGPKQLDMVRAATAYSLPDDLAAKVSLVDKLLRLPQMVPAKVAPAEEGMRSREDAVAAEADDGSDPFNSCVGAGVTCHGSTNPQVLQQRYGFKTKTNFTAGNGMACTEFQLQGIDAEDLANFASGCGVDHVEVNTVTGAGGEALAGVEALLDVEYIEAVAAPIPLTVINSISYSILDWATALNNDASPAWVQSVSYGNDEVQQVSADYMYACNTQFMANGARGLSVLFASGDQGVWGRSGHADDVFHPDFPAGSPYITAVGGTQFTVTGTVGSETTWADGGGGFSNTFPIPEFQASAVAAYLASGVALPDAAQFNATGRAYPDVAALAGVANGYCVAAKGNFLKVGGTSAACPVFAGAVAMLNDELLAAGQAPMGYLNPWIYGVAGPAGVFFDVTTGTNNAGLGNGFTAIKGWDPATGFGTPNYPAMLKLVMA
jgi:tripeptidyl-peptidase-1